MKKVDNFETALMNLKSMMIFIDIDCLNTYGVELNVYNQEGGRPFEQIRNGMRTIFECLKVTLSRLLENLFHR